MYYLLYADEYEMPSKVAFDPEEPSLGRIRADSIAPPHSPASIKRCISRVERTSALAHANLFAEISCDAPLKEGYVSILGTNGPGLSPNNPMAIVKIPIVQIPILQVKKPLISDGSYLIKNRAGDLYWNAGSRTIARVHFSFESAGWTADVPMGNMNLQVNEHSPIIQSIQRIIFFFEVGHHP